MTDRISGFLVVLDKDMRADDAQATINAISQIKGVIGVTNVVQDVAQTTAKIRANSEWSNALFDLIHAKSRG